MTTRFLRSIVPTMLALLAAGPLAAQPPSKVPPPTATATRPEETPVPSGYRGSGGRVYVGEPAPGFELTSASEKRVRLSSFIGTRILLCFADRRESMSAYRAVAESLLADSVVMLAIARDSPRALRAQIERDALPFDMLSDPTGEISAIYGSYDFATSSIRPGYVLVGRAGIVRMTLFGQRLPAKDLLQITRYALAGL